MANYVLDSYALLAFFRNEKGADKISQILTETAEGKHHLYMSYINAGEVFYMAYRKDGAAKANLVWKAMHQFPISLIEIDSTHTLKAAIIKGQYKMSFADAFAATLSISKKAILITGDTEFNVLLSEPGFKLKYIHQ
jgi:ribonuclease VapC